MCYGEISGIDRDHHDYPESTIAQKVIFESSFGFLWILNHLRTISEPSQDHLNYLNISQLDLWCGTTTSGPEKCSQVQLIHSASELIPKIKMLSKPSQNHKPSQNYLKTISKPSQNHLKPSQAISNHPGFIPDAT